MTARLANLQVVLVSSHERIGVGLTEEEPKSHCIYEGSASSGIDGVWGSDRLISVTSRTARPGHLRYHQQLHDLRGAKGIRTHTYQTRPGVKFTFYIAPAPTNRLDISRSRMSGHLISVLVGYDVKSPSTPVEQN